MGVDLEELEARLDCRFRDRNLLQRALTHRSRAVETAPGGEARHDNEQLEFLGDAILGFLVSEMLVSKFPDLSEGRLSRIRARLVNAGHLHQVALDLNLGDFLLLGRGEEMSGGRGKRALLADSVEAVIAAIYLDCGYEAARRFVAERIIGDPASLAAEQDEITDFKGALQELTQGEKLPAPRYRVVASSGPEHSKKFTVEVSVGDRWSARAQGQSKKHAGQNAAARLLEHLQRSLPSQ